MKKEGQRRVYNSDPTIPRYSEKRKFLLNAHFTILPQLSQREILPVTRSFDFGVLADRAGPRKREVSQKKDAGSGLGGSDGLGATLDAALLSGQVLPLAVRRETGSQQCARYRGARKSFTEDPQPEAGD